MTWKKFEQIVHKVNTEGLGYFLLDYASPEHISPEADEQSLKFKSLWIKTLPLLREMDSLINTVNEDDDEDDEDEDEDDEDDAYTYDLDD